MMVEDLTFLSPPPIGIIHPRLFSWVTLAGDIDTILSNIT